MNGFLFGPFFCGSIFIDRSVNQVSLICIKTGKISHGKFFLMRRVKKEQSKNHYLLRHQHAGNHNEFKITETNLLRA